MSKQSPTANGRGQFPEEPFDEKSPRKNETDEANTGKGHGPLKGTDTPATTDAEYADREKGKRTTM